VGTPTLEHGGADLSQIESVALQLAAAEPGRTLFVEKSTVPVGTGEWLQATVFDHLAPGRGFEVASNPEFLQEGHAVRDTLRPTRLVVGTRSERARSLLLELYRPIIARSNCPVITTGIATAELSKQAANAFLATKISFINQVAELCEQAGGDVEVVAHTMGTDPRIGPAFLRAGIGYGGSCFPKDVRALHRRAVELGVEFPLVAAAHRVNQERRSSFVERARSMLGGLMDRRIAIWGLAFKPGTDDLRDAPAIDIATRLVKSGAQVVAHDPAASEAAKGIVPGLEIARDPLSAVRGADILLLCTEWAEYLDLDLADVKDAMAQPLVLDGRNLFDARTMAERGFRYASMGRPSHDVSRPDRRGAAVQTDS
jgi:UDPglucose 6-dehydrogenase